jgi:hypothetical protein
MPVIKLSVSQVLGGLAGFSFATLAMAGSAISSPQTPQTSDRQTANAAATISNVQGSIKSQPRAKSLPTVVNFSPRPGKDKPTTASGAGTRGICFADADQLANGTASSNLSNQDGLTLILPNITPALTAEARPTFLFYVPKTKAQQVEFRLFAKVENELGEPQTGIYRQAIDLSDELNGQSGVISYTLPANAPALELNQSYSWSVSLVCNTSKRQRDIVMHGDIERVELSNTVATAIAQADPAEQALLYAQDGIWYEAAAILASLNSEKDSNAMPWQSLLSSELVNLSTIANTTIVPASAN